MSSPLTITGLTNGQTYTIVLQAVNSFGASSNTSTSTTVTPYTNPDPPTNLYASAGNAQATITFTTPFSTGGGAITNYKYSTNGGTTFTTPSPAKTSSPITITGLTNGQTYTIVLETVTSFGVSSSASTSTTVTPRTVPDPPTNLSATSGNTQATITFTAPTSTGGSAITNYKYSTDGGTTFTTASPAQTASPLTITGLTNGETYTIVLQAVNSAGPSTSSQTTTVTPCTVPDPPTNLYASTEDSQTTVTFTAPASTGGSAITNYNYSTDGGTTFTTPSPAHTASPLTITGLTNGETYTIVLQAVNSAGTSTSSQTTTVTPCTIPDPPTDISANPGNTKATITFTAPTNTGGSAITNYQYSTDAGVTFTARSPAATTSPIIITGLTNGRTYTIMMKAVNSVGTSVSSSVVTVTPVASSVGSVVYDGNSANYITLSPGVTIGSGAYTVECWFYNNSGWPGQAPNIRGLLGGSSLGGLSIFFNNSTNVTTDRYGSGEQRSYTMAEISTNAWHHFALVRNSSLVESVFIDGVKATACAGAISDNVNKGQQTNTLNYSGTSQYIGEFYQGIWSGYFTNYRIVTGTAVYDPTADSITIPSSALTVITNTQYLMLGGSVNKDSANVQTVTNNGITSSSELPNALNP
jgi:hypothetical protein